mgnify:CR=1 FL=1
MDSFAKKYLIGLIGVAVLVADWVYFGGDSRVAAINARLAEDPELASYVYPFRVRRIEDGIAVMGSPRSAQVPVMRFLRTAFPRFGNTPVTDPEMMAAQATLVERQSRAAELAQADPDVDGVRWELDERWYAEQGVFLGP